MALPKIVRSPETSTTSSYLHWTGILIILQAVLSFFLLLFLPEVYDPAQINLVIIVALLAISFGYIYYFTPLSQNPKLVFLPALMVPGLTLLFMYALPTVSFYYLFIFFLLAATSSLTVIWRGQDILFIVTGSSVLVTYSLLFPALTTAQALMLGFALTVSFILFNYIFIRVAQALREPFYQQKRLDTRQMSQMRSVLRRYKAIIDTIRDGIIMVDHENRVWFLNQVAEQLLGWPINEVRGKNVEGILGFTPQFLTGEAKMRMFFGEILIGPIKQLAVRLKNKRDETVFTDITLYPLNLPILQNRARRYFMITLHDVTSDIERERVKLDFVAMAAHELRAPITAIRGYLSVLQDEIMSKIDAEQKNFLGRAVISSQSLADLVENILSITKIERGERPIQKQPMDWVNFMSLKIAELSPQAEKKGIKLAWISPPKQLPQVMADPLLIPEVVNNLIGNAIKYTEKGRVRVWSEYNDEKNVVVTHIQDTGPGIPEESLHHLFERFYRVTSVLGKSAKGTGLGLYISKAVVQQHGGEIWVESEAGKGSTFSFSLLVA